MSSLGPRSSKLKQLLAWLNKDRSFGKGLSHGKDRQFFIENLSMLTSSGMGISQALEAIALEIKSKPMRATVTEMQHKIDSGTPLWRAIDTTKLFPGYTVSLLRIGEESGHLSDNLKIVGAQQAKERAFRSQLRAALMYPAFVLVLTLVIGVGIAWFILPKLSTVFESMNMKLPLITRISLAVGSVLQDWGYIIVPLGAVVLSLGCYALFFHPKTKFIDQTLLYAMPGVKGLIQELEVARFGYLLSTLLGAGIQVTQALESLEHASTFPFFQKLYAHLGVQLGAGNSFRQAFTSYAGSGKFIPRPIQQLVIAGEQSGSLTAILMKISLAYEAKVEITTKNLTVILEPVLLIIVWFGVLGVALSVILPVYGLIGGFNAGV